MNNSLIVAGGPQAGQVREGFACAVRLVTITAIRKAIMTHLPFPRLRNLALIAAAGVLATSAAFAQQRERLPRACVSEIRALCGSDRAQVRACLRERYAELSEGCAGELRARMQGRTPREGARAAPEAATAPARTLAYGDHRRQQVDVYLPESGARGVPLVLFIHGGGWTFGNHKQSLQDKPAHFTGAGYAFASTGYRLLPDAPVEQQAADVGAALRALRAEAAQIGFDPDLIVLMGHSAGAHLAALVASDPSYAGDAFGAVRGVVLLDGAGYDVPTNMARGDLDAPRLYEAAFGTDPARQAALSPITHVGGPDAPHWLVLYVADRPASRGQSEALAAALAEAGGDAQALAITGTDHGRLNRELGTAQGAQQTRAVDAFLARILR